MSLTKPENQENPDPPASPEASAGPESGTGRTRRRYESEPPSWDSLLPRLTEGERVESDLPARDCPACGVSMTRGWQYGARPVYSHLRECPVLEEREREEGRRLKEQFAGLPPVPPGEPAVYLESFGAHWDVDAENGYAHGWCVRFLEAYREEGPPKSGLTLFGHWGCGKTTLAVALGRSLLRAGTGLLFANVPEEMERLKARFRTGGVEKRLRRLQAAPVLILDDLGRERASPWTVDQVLYTVIDGRYRAGLPTLATTNETTDSLQAKWEKPRTEHGEAAQSAGAVVDRLRERSPWVRCGGSSRRAPKLDF